MYTMTMKSHPALSKRVLVQVDQPAPKLTNTDDGRRTSCNNRVRIIYKHQK